MDTLLPWQQRHVLIALLSEAVRASFSEVEAWFPLDRNAIVKSHDYNRFWLTTNVLVKI